MPDSENLILTGQTDNLRRAIHAFITANQKAPVFDQAISSAYEQLKLLDPVKSPSYKVVRAVYLTGCEDMLYHVVAGNVSIKKIKDNM
jgi:hypothetical protein